MYFNFLLDDNPRENKQVVWGTKGAKNNIAIFCFQKKIIWNNIVFFYFSIIIRELYDF
jgi:hypothetical protein